MGKTHIDFNIDGAQGFGVFRDDKEFEALNYVSTVNISCGFHAGDPLSIREMLLKCKDKNICIGAHIGFNDLQGFGYRTMDLSEEEIEAIVLYQLGAIVNFAKSYSLGVEVVRPHGALYRMCSENYEVASAVVRAIKKFDKWLAFTCLENEILDRLAAELNVVVNKEIPIDRHYSTDAKLSWDNPNFIYNDVALNRLRTIMYSGQIKLPDGNFMPVKCDTLHFGLKNPEAIKLLKQANELVVPTPSAYNKAELSGWM